MSGPEQADEADAYDGTEDDLMTAGELARDRAAAGLPPGETRPEQAAVAASPAGPDDLLTAAGQALDDAADEARELRAEHDSLTERIAELVTEGNELRAENREMRHLNAWQGDMIHKLRALLGEVLDLMAQGRQPSAAQLAGWWECTNGGVRPAVVTAGTEHLAELVTEVNELRAELERWPRCPHGCGCRLGTEDADARECGCDGPCCGDDAPAVAFAGAEHLTDQITRLVIPDEDTP